MDNKEFKYKLTSAGKYALFDSKTGKRLTDYVYDKIIISFCGNHILLKCNDMVSEDGRHYAGMGTITYCAVADNDGNIKEFPGLVFGYRGGFTNGVCVAYSEETKQNYLMNANGKLISKGYKRLRPINNDFVCGLYENIENNDMGDIVNYNIVYEDGTELNYLLESDDSYVPTLKDHRFNELNTLEKATSAISKFGVNILNLLPNTIYKDADNYLPLAVACNNYVLSHSTHLVNDVRLAIEILSKVANNFSPKNNRTISCRFPTTYAGETEGIRTLIERDFNNFYKLLISLNAN